MHPSPFSTRVQGLSREWGGPSGSSRTRVLTIRTVPGAPDREFQTFSQTFLETSSLENYHEFEVSKYKVFSQLGVAGPHTS